MEVMAFEITSVTIIYSTVFFSGADWPVTGEFPRKGPVMRKMFPFDDVIMWVVKVWEIFRMGTPLTLCDMFLCQYLNYCIE